MIRKWLISFHRVTTPQALLELPAKWLKVVRAQIVNAPVLSKMVDQHALDAVVIGERTFREFLAVQLEFLVGRKRVAQSSQRAAVASVDWRSGSVLGETRPLPVEPSSTPCESSHGPK